MRAKNGLELIFSSINILVSLKLSSLSSMIVQHAVLNILNPLEHGSQVLLVVMLVQVTGIVQQTAGGSGDKIVAVVGIFSFVEKH